MYAVNIYVQAFEVPGLKIFKYDGAVFFANFDYFRSQMYEKTGLSRRIIVKEREQEDLEKGKCQNKTFVPQLEPIFNQEHIDKTLYNNYKASIPGKFDVIL